MTCALTVKSKLNYAIIMTTLGKFSHCLFFLVTIRRLNREISSFTNRSRTFNSIMCFRIQCDISDGKSVLIMVFLFYQCARFSILDKSSNDAYCQKVSLSFMHNIHQYYFRKRANTKKKNR